MLATKHGLTVSYRHIFTDIDYSGDTLPSCWIYNENQQGRPALSSLITAIETEDIKYVIVRRMDRLGTSSEVLNGLLDIFTANDVYIIATPENQEALAEDPTEAFAISILHPRIRYDTETERAQKALLKKKKIEEISRLKAKLHRLEAEVAQM